MSDVPATAPAVLPAAVPVVVPVDTPGRRRLLVGYDGSLASASAALWAVQMLPSARVDVLHLWQPPYDSPVLREQLRGEAASAADLEQALEAEGAAQAQWVARLGAGIVRSGGWEATPLTRRSCGGEGYHLAEAAEESGADLVVVGARGASAATALLGSTTDLLVHVSSVPVLVVPWPLAGARRDAAPLGPLLVADDGTPGARHALRAVRRLLPGRPLVRAHVVPDDRAAAGSGTEEAEGRGLQHPEEAAVEQLARVGHGARGTASALLRAADRHGAAAVVAGSRGRSALREVLLGSTALALLHRARRPVLVVPSPVR